MARSVRSSVPRTLRPGSTTATFLPFIIAGDSSSGCNWCPPLCEALAHRLPPPIDGSGRHRSGDVAVDAISRGPYADQWASLHLSVGVAPLPDGAMVSIGWQG